MFFFLIDNKTYKLSWKKMTRTNKRKVQLKYACQNRNKPFILNNIQSHCHQEIEQLVELVCKKTK
jgi:hypothetical protein